MPGAQSVELAQLSRQLPSPPHTNGAHDLVPLASIEESPSAEQVAPVLQIPALHENPAAHSSALAHAPRHALVAGSHLYFPHDEGAGASQCPLPSQVDSGCAASPVHCAGLQVTAGPAL